MQKLGTIIKVKNRPTFKSFCTTMLIGYARVSTHDQNLDLQQDALLGLGPDHHNLPCHCDTCISPHRTYFSSFRYLSAIASTAAQLERMPVAPLQLGLLARFDRPMPKVTDYDRLLVGGGRR